MKKGRKLKNKQKRMEKIKWERKTRPRGEMVSINRQLDYKIIQITNYAQKSNKGNGCVKKAVQNLRVRYPDLFRLK